MVHRKKQNHALSKEVAIRKTKSAKIATLKDNSIAKISVRRSRRLERKAYKPIVADNGLLSMEIIPSFLIDIVERNAIKSPLLHLPFELRNKIWNLAMAGYIVHIYDSATMVELATDKMFELCTGHAIERLAGGERQFVRSAFHLPEVCRQIYSETAMIAYAHSTFIIDLDWLKHWANTLTPAHRAVIADVEMFDMSFESYLNLRRRIVLKDTFPGLRRIHVDEEELDLVISFRVRDKGTNSEWTCAQWKDWMHEKVKHREGEDVELIFRKSLPWNEEDDEAAKGDV